MIPEQLPDGQEFLRFTSSWDGCEQRTLMLPNPKGDWVHFWDVEKIIKQRDEARAEAKRAHEDGARAMKYEMVRIAMRLTYDGKLWPELMLRLKEASVHEGEDKE